MSVYTFKHNRYSSHNQVLDMITPQSRVMDIGCGKGLLSGRLARMGCEVIGVDREAGDASFVADMECYIQHDLECPMPPVPGGPFDYVIAADVLEHLRNRKQLLMGITSNLKPQGTLIASTGNIALFAYRFLLLLGRFEYREKGILDEDHVHLFTLSSFCSELEDSGFTIVDRRYTPIPFERVFSGRFARGCFVELLTQLYQGMVRTWPRMFAYQVILKAKINTQGPD